MHTHFKCRKCPKRIYDKHVIGRRSLGAHAACGDSQKTRSDSSKVEEPFSFVASDDHGRGAEVVDRWMEGGCDFSKCWWDRVDRVVKRYGLFGQ